MSGNRDRKLIPYKLGIFLLYGFSAGLERVTASDIVIDTSAVANHLNITNARLREYLADLTRLGVIDDLHLGHGYARIQLATPEGYEVAPKTVNATAIQMSSN